MIPLKLTLKGFKGIKSGLNKDIITIDLTDVPEGRIALVGPNGKGKSTILQNLHPYLLMPDRVKTYSPSAFSYYNEVFLSDSQKEFIWEINNTVYKTLVEINTKRRRTKAYLYIKKENDWELVPETKDGNVKSYNEIIEKILISPQLFFVSIFNSQEARKLFSYSKGEMFDVFSELLQLGKLEEYKQNTNNAISILTNQRNNLLQTIEEYKNQIQGEDKLKEELTQIKKQIIEKNKEIENLEKQIERQEKELKELLTQESTVLEKQKHKETILNQINNKQKQIKELKHTEEEKRKFYRSHWTRLKNREKELISLIKQIPLLKAKKQELSELQTEVNKLKTNISNLDKKHKDLNSNLQEITKKESELFEKEKQLQNIQKQKENRLAKLKADLQNKQKLAQLLNETPCDTSMAEQCKFVKNAVIAQKELPIIEKEIQNLINSTTKEEKKLIQQIDSIKQQTLLKPKILNEIEELINKKQQINKKLIPLEEQINKLNEEIRELTKTENAEAELKTIKENLQSIKQEGKIFLDSLAKQIQTLEEEIKNLNIEANKIKVDLSITKTRENKEKEVNNLKTKLETKKKEETDLKIKLGKIEESLDNIEKLKNKIEELDGQIQKLNKEIKEWNTVYILYKELIPLEIEDAGPEISEIANQLLYTCYGPRFSITINTQEFAKSKKKELKDTFDILVYDSERDEKKSLRYMSGGEKVWIEEAIMRAISLYNHFRSNRKIETLFTDEKDGALDENNRIKYLKMKEKVLQLGGFKREYFISHSSTIQEMCDYIINLETF